MDNFDHLDVNAYCDALERDADFEDEAATTPEDELAD